MSESTSYEEEFDPYNIPPLHRLGLKKQFTDEQLEELANEGVEILTGQFTRDEDAKIRRNMDAFLRDYPERTREFLLGYFQMSRSRNRQEFLEHTKFYARLAHGMPCRTTDSVRRRARKILHPYAEGTRGKVYSTTDEERLRYLSSLYGKNYMAISEGLRRTPASVERKLDRMNKKLPQFNIEEREYFLNSIYDFIRENKKTLWIDLNSIPWSMITEKMRHTNVLYPQDAYISEWKRHLSNIAEIHLIPILSKIKSNPDVQEIGDVDWSAIADEHNLCNGKSIRRLFRKASQYFEQNYSKPAKWLEMPFKRKVKKMLKFYDVPDYRSLKFLDLAIVTGCYENPADQISINDFFRNKSRKSGKRAAATALSFSGGHHQDENYVSDGENHVIDGEMQFDAYARGGAEIENKNEFDRENQAEQEISKNETVKSTKKKRKGKSKKQRDNNSYVSHNDSQDSFGFSPDGEPQNQQQEQPSDTVSPVKSKTSADTENDFYHPSAAAASSSSAEYIEPAIHVTFDELSEEQQQQQQVDGIKNELVTDCYPSFSAIDEEGTNTVGISKQRRSSRKRRF